MLLHFAGRLPWMLFQVLTRLWLYMSSWVWMCRNSTGRTNYKVLGHTSCEAVRKGNIMVSRIVLLYLLASARGCLVFLEQPVSSMVYLHARFQELFLGRSWHTFLMSVALARAHTHKESYIHKQNGPRPGPVAWGLPWPHVRIYVSLYQCTYSLNLSNWITELDCFV